MGGVSKIIPNGRKFSFSLAYLEKKLYLCFVFHVRTVYAPEVSY